MPSGYLDRKVNFFPKQGGAFMEILTTIQAVRDYVAEKKKQGKTIGFVPTIVYLHHGHLELMRQARARCQVVVVSIFVNPKQFGPNEDYARYPRDLRRDAAMCRHVGVDAIFAPGVEEMYHGEGFKTYVEVTELTEGLCGASRPGNFRGVTTVVAKLFNIVQADVAFFGQKDAQQVIVIKRMVADLNMPVEIEVVPIVREPDGLAMSSRNIYLSPEERLAALVLYRALMAARSLVLNGEREAGRVMATMRQLLEAEPLARVDYVEIRDVDTLVPVATIKGRVLIALAVFVGRTRLIDNIILEV